MRDIIVHGHFYQPTRVNPWTNVLEPQPSATPFRDWNERIAYECYAPNLAARLLGEEGRVRATRNNYASLTFDIGPTLLSWIASERPVILEGLRAADRRSVHRFGSGSAIAQPYHHPILPLCDPLDRATEIRWGLAIFERVFEREAEGMWLSEAAVDIPTLEALADAALSFVILAPHQIDAVLDESKGWRSLTEQESANRAFRIPLPSGRAINALVYDGATSRAIAFEGLLNDGQAFADRLVSAAEQTGLALVATDGESYGHHHTFGDMALAYALDHLDSREGVRLTNAAAWLKANPPRREARILEPSSWSCAHGVGRWSRDCGCKMDHDRGWHQRWRGPFRSALEALRDDARVALRSLGDALFASPSSARDAYGEVIGRPSHEFLSWYATKAGVEPDPERAHAWLEVHRHLLAMFTSCAWFFDEVTGIEPIQNLRHAACAAGQLKELCDVDLSPALLEAVRDVPGNLGSERLEQSVLDYKRRPSVFPLPPTFHLAERRAGVLLPVSALGGGGPIGNLDGALEFVDWLAEAGGSLWQILPLVPTDAQGSPYSSWSTLSGNPDLVGLGGLERVGLLASGEGLPSCVAVDYALARTLKRAKVLNAAQRLLDSPDHPWFPELQRFQARADWASEAALFHAIKESEGGKPWWEWPTPLKTREPEALAATQRALTPDIERWRAALFLFEHQWAAVRRYAMARGIKLIGDMPIYVGQDSVDVWAHQRLFELDPDGSPKRVAGVPPDAYSETGQLWGNPLFDWTAMAEEGYAWWIARVSRALEQCDALRIDHFIAFARFWAVDATAEVATEGAWNPGPGQAVFDAIRQALGSLPLIAEDLGSVDETTCALRDSLGLPGMKVIQFGLDGDPNNPHAPGSHPPLSIAYSGTHDGPTARGWWEAQDAGAKARLALGADGRQAARAMVDMALSSEAFWALVPLQDLLELGDDARMNIPGTSEGNWRWRLPEGALTDELAEATRQRVRGSKRGLNT